MRMIWTVLALTLTVPARAAGEAEWNGALHKTVWEIVHGDPGTAVPAAPAKPAASGFNEHFQCTAFQFFSALQLEVEQVPPPHRAYPDPNEQGSVRVRLQGIRAAQAAQALGLAAGADSFEVLFPAGWCRVSQATPGVFSCEIPDWQWPRPTLAARAFDRDGNIVGTGALAVFRVG